MFFKTFKEARDYIKNDPSGKSLVRLENGAGYEVKSSQSSYLSKKNHVISSRSSKKKRIVLSMPPALKPATVQPIQKRAQTAKGKISHSKSPDGERATHSPLSINKYPKQYIDEPLGTREDAKKMRGRQSAINRSNKS